MRNLMLVLTVLFGLGCGGMGEAPFMVVWGREDLTDLDRSMTLCCKPYTPGDQFVECMYPTGEPTDEYLQRRMAGVRDGSARTGEKDALDTCPMACNPNNGNAKCEGWNTPLPDAVMDGDREFDGPDGTEETDDQGPLPDVVTDDQGTDTQTIDVPEGDTDNSDNPVTPDESADLGEPDTTLDNPPVEDTSVDNPPDQCLTPVPLHCESTPEATYYMDPRNFHCTHWAGESEPVCKPVLWYGNGCSRPYRQDGKYWANSTCFVIRKEKCPDILAVVSEDNKDKVIETCFSAAGSFWCFVTDGNGYAVVRDPTGYEKEFQVVEMEESELKRIDTDVCPTGS